MFWGREMLVTAEAYQTYKEQFLKLTSQFQSMEWLDNGINMWKALFAAVTTYWAESDL